MLFRLNARNIALCSALLILLFGTAAAQAPIIVRVSGYEIFLGNNCVIASTPGTCDATFTGWTGETAQGGWRAFPGTGLGIWSLQINYTGQPAFGGTVNIMGGQWHFLFINGLVLQGDVLSGTVTWPEQGSSILNSNCGTNVAVGTAALSIAGGGSATIQGCLHDLPKFTVIPPTVWGTYSFSF